MSGSIGFPDRNFQEFLDENGAFDPGLVDQELFFGSSAQQSNYAQRFEGTSYRVGAFVYYHDAVKPVKQLSGIRWRAGTYRKKPVTNHSTTSVILVAKEETCASPRAVP